MASIRAHCLNGLMQLTMRSRLRPGVTIDKMRERSARADSRFTKPISQCSVEEQNSPVAISRVSALGANQHRVILYLHGGGFCLYLPNLYKRHAARLSAATGAVTYLVDYRLAPENPLATCHDDAFTSYRWLLEQGHPSSSIIIAGDSAGGTLSVATCQRVRDAGLPLPAGLLLLSPGLFATFDTPSMYQNDGRDPMFRRQGLSYLRDITLCHGEDLTDPRVSPGLGSFAGLPPMRFDVGTTELLRDDSRLCAHKATEEGSIALLCEWHAMAHAYQVNSWLPETRNWLVEAGNFAHRCWAMSAAPD